MNKWEVEVQQSLLDSEKAAIKELEKQYAAALKDINEKVRLFQADIDLLDQALNQDGLDEATKRALLSQKRSKVYQQQYQQALKNQIGGIIDKLHSDSYATIDKYLKQCYEDGYIGTMYDIAKQGIPIIAPIDQAAMVRAILTDSKIVEGYYKHLGVNYAKLKKVITQEVSRGIATSLPYADIARNINNASNSGLFNAKRIARTEGHRIQQTSTRDAQRVAKSRGANVLKQWDATLDGKTRPSHARIDGEIRETDEEYSNGLMFPGDPSGPAAEVINCRCVSKTRARWALDEDELKKLQDRAAYFGLDKTENFEEFRAKYLATTKKPSYTILQKLNYSGNVTPEVEANLEAKLAMMPARHRELAESKISEIVVVDDPSGSRYDPRTKQIYISKQADNPFAIVHEYAHALDRAIGAGQDEKFIEIRKKGFENITIADIIEDEETFTAPIYRLEHEKFISLYQGRLYDGFYSGNGITLDTMFEYFSEGYREYVANPDNLKKHDPDLYDYFEGIT